LIADGEPEPEPTAGVPVAVVCVEEGSQKVFLPRYPAVQPSPEGSYSRPCVQETPCLACHSVLVVEQPSAVVAGRLVGVASVVLIVQDSLSSVRWFRVGSDGCTHSACVAVAAAGTFARPAVAGVKEHAPAGLAFALPSSALPGSRAHWDQTRHAFAWAPWLAGPGSFLVRPWGALGACLDGALRRRQWSSSFDDALDVWIRADDSWMAGQVLRGRRDESVGASFAKMPTEEPSGRTKV
jgi:hypothetical protein